MNSQICVDASLALKLVLDESDSLQARALWAGWLANDIQVLSPPLLLFEGTSVIRNKVHRKLISLEAGKQALAAFLAQGIQIEYPADLHEKAWELAHRFNRPNAYDSHYLALAKALNCEFWTADERLYNAVSPTLSWVQWLGQFVP